MTQADKPNDPLIGTRLGSYRIDEFRGEGGFARVYLAEHESLGRRVALKVLWPHLATRPDFIGRFLREARAAAALQHENIVQVYDVGSQGQYNYIVMDFIDGQTLTEMLQKKKRLGPRTALSIVRQIGAALDYAHSKGVVHRDVKPSNILVDRSGKAYLSDFGIAKASWASGMTKTGTSVGTPEYMSPEQAEGRDIDHRSDLYALGIVLYEMLCGSPPFHAETPLAVLYKQVKEAPPPFSQWKVRVGKQVEEVVAKAVAKEPGQRFQSGAELAKALEEALEGRHIPAGPVVRTPVPVPQPRARWMRRRPVVIGTVVLAASLAVGGLLLALSGGGKGSGKGAVVPAVTSSMTATTSAGVGLSNRTRTPTVAVPVTRTTTSTRPGSGTPLDATSTLAPERIGTASPTPAATLTPSPASTRTPTERPPTATRTPPMVVPPTATRTPHHTVTARPTNTPTHTPGNTHTRTPQVPTNTPTLPSRTPVVPTRTAVVPTRTPGTFLTSPHSVPLTPIEQMALEGFVSALLAAGVVWAWRDGGESKDS